MLTPMKRITLINNTIWRLLQVSFVLLILVFTHLSSVGQSYSNTLEDSTFSEYWTGTSTIDTGYSHSGSYYSLTDSLQPYGLGLEMFFPEERRGKNTILQVEGWVKSELENAHSFFVLTLLMDGKQVFWKGIPLSPILKEKNQWFRFYDSISIPSNITSKGKIKAFLWNAGKRQKVGLDDLKLTFSQKENPTYLPIIPSIKYSENLINNDLLFSNIYYAVFYDIENKKIIIKNSKGENIANNISYLLETNSSNKDSLILDNFDFNGSKNIKERSILSFSIRTKANRVNIEMNCDFSPRIGFQINEKYRKKISVSRSTIIINSGQKPSEVYRFNRQSHITNFQEEYWLGKQGIKLGDSDSSLLIYHNSNVSSLQYDSKKDILLVNLDWEKDHPFLRFPLNSDSSDWKVDESSSLFKKSSKQEYSFTIYVGSKVKNIPRFMKNPFGFESCYIWTEHADFSDIKTNRATYFGSENISKAEKATGGFVKYGVPVTKSVFYDNPDSITNLKASNGQFSGLESTIKTDTAFSGFLDEIYGSGSEICLHTPEQYTSTSFRLEEAMVYMQERFASPTWIDHGYNNKEENNREDLVCDASDKKSPVYLLDKWEEHKINYFWNPYYEDYFTFKQWGFNSTIEKAYTGWGDLIPKPDYWQHKTKTANIYHWPTASALFIDNNDMWSWIFSPIKFEDFIHNWSVEINHCYPAWVDQKKGFWTYNSDSIIVAQDGFNNTLKLMSDYRNQGKLMLSTVEDFMNYNIAIDNIDYVILTDGRIQITNTSDHSIYGLSLASKAKYVVVDRLKPEQKLVGEDLVFWFDIGVGETKLIRLID